MSADLTTKYLGLDLAHPIVPSASPMTGDLGSLRQLEAAGASAVVLWSLFEEQIVHDEEQALALAEFHADSFGEAVGGYFPTLEDYNTGPGEYLKLIREAKENLSIPVIASLNGTSPGGWLRYGKLMEEAGADALVIDTSHGHSKNVMDAIKKIRSMPDGKKPVIIAVTASVFDEERAAVMSIGCDGIIMKPFKESELIDTLLNFLNVEFIFSADKLSTQRTTITKDRSEISQSVLKVLPQELIERLRKTVEVLEIEETYKIIKEIRGVDVQIAEYLNELVEEYRFDTIQKILK